MTQTTSVNISPGDSSESPAAQALGSSLTKIFLEKHTDSATLASNAFADIPDIDSGNFTVTEQCILDVDFRVCGTLSGATTGVQYQLILTQVDTSTSANVPGCGSPTTIAANLQPSGMRCQFPPRSSFKIIPGTYRVRAQYKCGAGTNLSLQPNTVSGERCSLAVSQCPPTS